MFTPSLDGALQRAATIECLDQHTRANPALSERGKVVAGLLLSEGKLYSKSTNAELQQRLYGAWSERTIQRGFRDLETHHYGKRKAGANTSGRAGYLPPLWTWYTDNIQGVKILNTQSCHPVITSSLTDTTAYVQQGVTCYWQALREASKEMELGELKDNIYFSIYMQRLEETRGSGRSKFWAIVEDILTKEGAARQYAPAPLIVRRMRTMHIEPSSLIAQDTLEANCKKWLDENGAI